MSLMIGQTSTGADRAVRVDDDGKIALAADVDIDTTGLATSAKQDTGNTSLGTIATASALQATAAKQDTGNTSVASIDGKLGASAAPADAKTNASAASGFVQAFLSVFNGTTWDRLKSGVIAVGSTFTGMINTIPLALFNTTPATRTTGQGGTLETDATGNLRVTEQFLPASSATNITTATTTVVKSGAGRLARIVIAKPVTAATISIFDNTAGSGTSLGVLTIGTVGTTGNQPDSIEFGCAFATGLTVVTSGATDVTVIWD